MSARHEAVFGRSDQERNVVSSVPTDAQEKDRQRNRETVGGYEDPILAAIKKFSLATKRALLKLIGEK